MARFSYTALVRKADAYLRQQREKSRLFRYILPLSLFDEQLWLRKREGIARGAACGVFWALAPVPLQTIFAAVSALKVRGNMPIAIVSCWISIPGYQLIAWPLQWWLGAEVFQLMGGGSGASMATAKHAAKLLCESPHLLASAFNDIYLPLLAAEFIIGCLISCTLIAFLAYGLTMLLLCRMKDAEF